MLTRSFIFAKGITEDLERALWARGITSWELLRAHPEDAAEVIGGTRCQRVLESIQEAEQACQRGDAAWFRANWPEREFWRLWKGMCGTDRVAMVDIETTGLTPGYDQITVIGLADGGVHRAGRAFVAGRPQAGDETLERFCEQIRSYRLLVTFNGMSFDVPFIERQFREMSFRFEMPHLDLLPLARSLGLSGGLKDMEKQLGVQRSEDIKDVRGLEAIRLWGAWKAGDLDAYRRLTTYCKADCTNLIEVAELLYQRKWAQVHVAHAREIDFTAIKGEQQTLF